MGRGGGGGVIRENSLGSGKTEAGCGESEWDTRQARLIRDFTTRKTTAFQYDTYTNLRHFQVSTSDSS